MIDIYYLISENLSPKHGCDHFHGDLSKVRAIVLTIVIFDSPCNVSSCLSNILIFVDVRRTFKMSYLMKNAHENDHIHVLEKVFYVLSNNYELHFKQKISESLFIGQSKVRYF